MTQLNEIAPRLSILVVSVVLLLFAVLRIVTPTLADLEQSSILVIASCLPIILYPSRPLDRPPLSETPDADQGSWIDWM